MFQLDDLSEFFAYCGCDCWFVHEFVGARGALEAFLLELHARQDALFFVVGECDCGAFFGFSHDVSFQVVCSLLSVFIMSEFCFLVNGFPEFTEGYSLQFWNNCYSILEWLFA